MNSIPGVQWWYTKSALTLISDFFLLSEVATMWQTDGVAHKLKPRSFNKSTYLWVHLVDFHPWCELYLTYKTCRIVIYLYKNLTKNIHNKKVPMFPYLYDCNSWLRLLWCTWTLIFFFSFIYFFDLIFLWQWRGTWLWLHSISHGVRS